VFASSTSSQKARSTTTAHGRSAQAPATAPAASKRSATGDLWSGVSSLGRSPLAAAEATSGASSGGLGASVVAGMLILGVGLAGLTGAFLYTAGRRRTAASATRRTTTKR
jgi:hypothetical protein